ncbi:MAG TPA: TatD family hydrolase [Opitutaceae bacterium]|nr:TatD family hydrolase [Opitutaceae bacterium]
MYFDAHNHLQDEWLAPHRAQVFADLAAAGVHRVVANGTSESDWAAVEALAAETALTLPSFGLHPWDAGNRSSAWLEKLRGHLDANPSAGVGEIGLDRWILDRARPDDPRLKGLRRAPLEEQTEVFLAQLELAAQRNLPASIHCLDAFGPLYDLLRREKLPARGFLLHAYSGPAEMVAGFAKLGAYFSFNGAFLDPRKQRLRDLYAVIPADRLLVETDAPAMRLPADREKFPPLLAADGSPANHPANVAVTYSALAALRATPLDSLAAQVEKNFRRLFTLSF